MGFQCGIVGLPNVGKSTLFNALTAAGVAAENYPFCTVEPNTGIVEVPDERLALVAGQYTAKKVTPTTLQFLDIAGLVKGASHGEGLGNQFLGHISRVDAIVQVVRCFADDQVSHVSGNLDPLDDIQTIHAELCLKDLETVEKRLAAAGKLMRVGNKEVIHECELLERLQAHLDQGKPIRRFVCDEPTRKQVDALYLLTAKEVLYLANVGEEELLAATPGAATQAVFAHAEREGSQALALCARLEEELIVLDPEERRVFMAEYGLSELGLLRLIEAGYRLLGLITFFTGNENEVRAWTVPRGTPAPVAAGRIHTDFEAGFISAEVFACADLAKHGSIRALREAGLVHTHGRDYQVQDGDVIRFRFNA